MIFSEYYDIVDTDGFNFVVRPLALENNTVKILSGRLFMNFSTRLINGEIALSYGEFIITDIRFDRVKNEVTIDMEIYDSRKHDNIFKEKNLFDVVFEKLVNNLSTIERFKLFKNKRHQKSLVLNKMLKEYAFVNLWLNNVGAAGHNINLLHSQATEIKGKEKFYPYGNKYDRLVVPQTLSLLNDNQYNLISTIILDIFDSNIVDVIDEGFDEFISNPKFQNLKILAEELEEDEEPEEFEDSDQEGDDD